jgi:hypothetical protein
VRCPVISGFRGTVDPSMSAAILARKVHHLTLAASMDQHNTPITETRVSKF